VHPAIDTRKVHQAIQCPGLPAAEWIENPYRKVWVRIECCYFGVESFCEHVIDQQADTYTPFCRIQQPQHKYIADGVVLDQIVLRVDRVFCPLDQQQAQRQRVDAVLGDIEPRLAVRDALGKIGYEPAKNGIGRFGRSERPGFGFRVVQIDVGATTDKRDDQQQPTIAGYFVD
jgi:hypothetical protein